MILAANQSNYIPWKGYFDLIHDADKFVFYDEVQYTLRDWRNRNLIKTSGGAKWISIPVVTKGKFYQKISETVVSDKEWAKKHWNTVYENYHKTRYFNLYAESFEKAYAECSQMEYLCDINYYFISLICSLLGIETQLLNSKDLTLTDGKVERVVQLCKDLRASVYLCGPAAKSYLSEDMFEQNGIRLTWKDYSGYPEYYQKHKPFEHGVSILDVLFNTGEKAPYFIWGWRDDPSPFKRSKYAEKAGGQADAQ